MTLGIAIAAVHLLSLVFGVTFLLMRASALKALNQQSDVPRVLFWDNIYGLLAMIWLGSGLWRAFGGLEKGSDYYLRNHVFWTKLLFVAAILACETPILVALIRTRIQRGRGNVADLGRLTRLIRLHWYELGAIVFAALCAVFMARGVGYVAPKSVRATLTPDAKNGALIYRNACLPCHREDGRGADGRLAADFVGDKTRLAKSDDALLRSVLDGIPRTAMPPFRDRLSEKDARDVIQYLRREFSNRP